MAFFEEEKHWQNSGKTVARIYKEQEMITEKWHDLRKDPNDLPKTSDWVWAIHIDYPKEIEMDSYDPNDKGKEYTEIIVDKHENYLAIGWWNATRDGMITHWMYIEKPEPPTD